MTDQLTTFEIYRSLDRIKAGQAGPGDALKLARLLWRESVSHVAQYAAGAWLEKNGEESDYDETRPWNLGWNGTRTCDARRQAVAPRGHVRRRGHSLWSRRKLAVRSATRLRHENTAAAGAAAASPTAAAADLRDHAAGAILSPTTILQRAEAERLFPSTTPTGEPAIWTSDL